MLLIINPWTHLLIQSHTELLIKWGATVLACGLNSKFQMKMKMKAVKNNKVLLMIVMMMMMMMMMLMMLMITMTKIAVLAV